MAEISADTLNALAEKIDSLDLTDTEQAVLDQVLARAARSDAEVEGFATGTDLSQLPKIRIDESAKLSPTAGKLLGGLAFASPKGPYTFASPEDPYA